MTSEVMWKCKKKICIFTFSFCPWKNKYSLCFYSTLKLLFRTQDIGCYLQISSKVVTEINWSDLDYCTVRKIINPPSYSYYTINKVAYIIWSPPKIGCYLKIQSGPCILHFSHCMYTKHLLENLQSTFLSSDLITLLILCKTVQKLSQRQST